MALYSTTVRNEVLADGVNTTFTFNFTIFEEEHLKVYVELAADGELSGTVVLISPTLYTVNTELPSSSGSITYPKSGSPLPAGSRVTLERKVPYSQEFVPAKFGDYNRKLLERQLDLTVMQIQQLYQEVLDLAASLTGDPDEPTPVELTIPVRYAFEDRYAMAAASIPSNVYSVEVMSWNLGDETNKYIYGNYSVSAFKMRRIRYDDVINYEFPNRAVIRTLDRFAPSIANYNVLENDPANGGYWVIDENAPDVTMFGAAPDAYIKDDFTYAGSNCYTAIVQWWQYYCAKAYKIVSEVPALAGRYAVKAKFGNGTFRLETGVVLRDPLSVPIESILRRAELDFSGATILMGMANNVGFDALDCEYLDIRGLHAHGSATETPLACLRMGRIGDRNTAARNAVRDCLTRVTAQAGSHWKVAAFWAIASETTLMEKNIWENYYTGASKVYGAAYDSVNWLNYNDPKAVTVIANGAGAQVTTATSHGYAVNDVICFRIRKYTATNAMLELMQRDPNTLALSQVSGTYAWKVSEVVNATNFKIKAFDDTAVDSTSWSAYDYAGGARAFVYKERWTVGLHEQTNLRATPYERHSQLHVIRTGEQYHCPNGAAAVMQGACGATVYTSAFGTGKEGFHFVSTGDAIEFDGGHFDLHLEKGQSSGLVCWARFITVAEPISTVMKVKGCKFYEHAINADVPMFDIGGTTTSVKFNGGEINLDRDSAAYAGQIFTPGWAIVIGTSLRLPDVQQLDDCTFRGGSILEQDSGNWFVVPMTLTVAEANTLAATSFTQAFGEGTLVFISNETGGRTLAFARNSGSGGTEFRTVHGNTVISA